MGLVQQTGALQFLFLTGLPLVTLAGWLRPAETSWTELCRLSYPIFLGFVVLSMFAGPFFYMEDSLTGPGAYHWWSFPLIILLVGFLVFFEMWQKTKGKISAIASILLVLCFCYYPAEEFLVYKRFGRGALVLWFVGIWFFTVIELKVRRKNRDWEKTPFLILGAVSVFALSYYPHIKASWGGGAPIPATVYFSKDSALSPNRSVKVQLIDESDDGFYVVGTNETKAIYIPRASVALIYFSDKMTDSNLLQSHQTP